MKLFGWLSRRKESPTLVEPKWLSGYSGQTTDELIALQGEFRTDSLVVAFEEAIMKKESAIGAESLTEEERIVLAVEALEREVNNGGYRQFFLNPTVEYAPIIVDSLRRIGCPTIAEITQGAIDALEITSVLTSESAQSAVQMDDQARDEELGKCDRLYFEGPENIEGQLFTFIAANQAFILA